MTPRDALDTFNDPGRRNEGRYFGKYRGLVKDNKDPSGLGRIQATVPAIPGMTVNWALPCAPYAGSQVGFYTMPPVGAKVWIEFEGGDPTFPIWSGCFWQDQEVPTEVGTNSDDPSQVKVFKTRVLSLFVDDTNQKGQVNLKFNDSTVQDCPTITVVLNATGLVITVQGPNGTSTVTITPDGIQTSSGTLATSTSKDTTVNAQGKIAATAGGDVTIDATGKITATAKDDASLTGNNCSLTANNNLSASATNSATLGGASATVQASTGSLTLSGQGGATLSSLASTSVSGASSLSLGGASISFMPA
jgi:uncharacterized protein involved in type VI secretion and phage assembly